MPGSTSSRGGILGDVFDGSDALVRAGAGFTEAAGEEKGGRVLPVNGAGGLEGFPSWRGY